MNGHHSARPARPGDIVLPSIVRTKPHLTLVELTWVEKRIEHWIRFGQPVSDQIIDRRRRVVSFLPDSIFAFVRWASNDFGTVVSRIDIVRAVGPGEPYQTLPFVRPGGEVFLKIDGWPRVQRVLKVIDAIEALDIDPADVAPEHWRHVHNRLTAGHEPRDYTLDRHEAWLKRREASASPQSEQEISGVRPKGGKP